MKYILFLIIASFYFLLLHLSAPPVLKEVNSPFPQLDLNYHNSGSSAQLK